MPLQVEQVQADDWGGVILTLNRGYRLVLFAHDSLPSERWRLFQPNNSEVHVADEHFVVTGKGIET